MFADFMGGRRFGISVKSKINTNSRGSYYGFQLRVGRESTLATRTNVHGGAVLWIGEMSSHSQPTSGFEEAS